MTLNEKNILIARFITDEPEVLEHDLKKAGTVESMHYHDAWNWLMPVVNKCVNENPEMDEHHKLFQNLCNALWAVDIEDVFEACVDYIIHHNKLNDEHS